MRRRGWLLAAVAVAVGTGIPIAVHLSTLSSSPSDESQPPSTQGQGAHTASPELLGAASPPVTHQAEGADGGQQVPPVAPPAKSAREHEAHDLYLAIRKLTPLPGAGLGPESERERRLDLTLHYLKLYDDVSQELTAMFVREAFTLYISSERAAEAVTMVERNAKSAGLPEWVVQEYRVGAMSASGQTEAFEREVHRFMADDDAPLGRRLRAAFGWGSVLEALKRFSDARDFYAQILELVGGQDDVSFELAAMSARAGLDRTTRLAQDSVR